MLVEPANGAEPLSIKSQERGIRIASRGQHLLEVRFQMKGPMLFVFACNSIASIAFLGGCATAISPEIQEARAAAAQSIQAEPPGNYFIGRRYYKEGFKFWGYVRRPGQPWASSQLVVLNENQKLAPDREQLKFGIDNNHEYKLYGSLSGEKIYESRSDGFYPEFVLKRYELVSTHPVPIFRSQYDPRAAAATRRVLIERPE